MPKMHIDEVYPKGSLYILNFQNGYTTDEFNSKSCSVFEDEITGEKTVATELCGLLYEGKEEKDDLGKTLILARNKETGKVRLFEVANVEMKPVLKSKENHNETVLDTSTLELSRKFGSKKQKKIMEQREKLKVNVETVIEQMHNVTANVTEDQLDLSSYVKTDSDDFYIPPINREADKPEDVYDLYKILTKEQYEKIYSEISERDYTSEISPWIRDMIGRKKLSEEHTVLAVYASVLLKLFSAMGRDILKKSFVACTISSTLNDIVLKNFTTFSNGKRNRPIQYKDKTFCYGILFLLLINDLKCDIDELCKNLKYNAKTMVTKFRVIGASVVPSGGKKYAQLKLPLSTISTFRRKSAKF